MPSEITVSLGPPGQRGTLALTIDGRPVAMRFSVSRLSEKLRGTIPDAHLDLMDIAAAVYASDCAVSRGGLTGSGVGADWRRRFHLEVPVRKTGVWSDTAVRDALVEALGFLSDDSWRFDFRARATEPEEQGAFVFGETSEMTATRVLMFSGGLDSFAGALEELVEREERVALVSHVSASKLEFVQKGLVADMRKRIGRDRLRHVTLLSQLMAGSRREGTQRTRSFLFAALGLVVARLFGLDRLSFYENGVVSLNLPLSTQVIGARATRTTHPGALRRINRLFEMIDSPFMISNPYLFRTKAEVLDTITRTGFADRIAFTHSCADVHNRTNQFSHCGRCSQCIDRRFAVLARGLERFDPGTSYAIDLLDGERRYPIDREMALSYVRGAQFFAKCTPAEFLRRFPVVARALDDTGETGTNALRSLHDLHRRHGTAVSTVIDKALGASANDPVSGSLVDLYRKADLWMIGSEPVPKEVVDVRPVVLSIDRRKNFVDLDGVGRLTGAAFHVIDALASLQLGALGKGLAPEDFPCIGAWSLAEALRLSDEASARRSIVRTRKKIGEILSASGHAGTELIETLPPAGYRLTPDRVEVRIFADPRKTEKARASRPARNDRP